MQFGNFGIEPLSTGGHNDHQAIIKYILQDVKFCLRCDFVSMSSTLFNFRWVFPGYCQVVGKLIIVFL